MSIIGPKKPEKNMMSHVYPITKESRKAKRRNMNIILVYFYIEGQRYGEKEKVDKNQNYEE